jgi:hypothetical protein
MHRKIKDPAVVPLLYAHTSVTLIQGGTGNNAGSEEAN